MQAKFRGGLLPRELTLSVAGSADVTLTDTQAKYKVHTYTGLLTGDIEIVFPVLEEDAGLIWTIDNTTTGAQTLGVRDADGAALTIPQGACVPVLWNGATMEFADSGQLTLDADIADVVFTSIARGDIIRRGATAWNNLAAKDAGKILIGDGTDITSATVSGDATLGSTGILTLSENLIRYRQTSISSLLTKGLRAVPFELVPAPGAGKVLEFVSATLMLDAGTEVLTEAGNDLAIRYTDGSGAIVSQAIEMTGFIDQAGDTLTNALPKVDAIAAKAGCENQALVLHNTSGAEIAGNATNDAVLRAKVAYRIHDTGW